LSDGPFLSRRNIGDEEVFCARTWTENIDGSLNDLRDLTVNAPHGQRIIPELSLAIHVEGYMTDIRLTVVGRTGIIFATSVHEILPIKLPTKLPGKLRICISRDEYDLDFYTFL